MADGNSLAQGFVGHVIAGMKDDDGRKKDTAMRARLRRADNPATEHYAWPYFVRFGVDLNDGRRLKAFATVAAALARAKPEKDGTFSFGKSLASCEQKAGRDESGPAEARLRRVLACRTAEEACDVLRPILRLMADKSACPLSYAGLLDDLLRFNEFTRRRWANDFYRRTLPEGEADAPREGEA